MGFSNILATGNMVAIKDGKVIVSGSGDDVQYYYASQDDVDEFIAQGLTFGEVLADNRLQQAMIDGIAFDDQEPVTADKRVDVATIARNSEIFIYVEPEFVPVGTMYELRAATIQNESESMSFTDAIVANGAYLYTTGTNDSKFLLRWIGSTPFNKDLVSGRSVQFLMNQSSVAVNMFGTITDPSSAALRNLGATSTAVFPE